MDYRIDRNKNRSSPASTATSAMNTTTGNNNNNNNNSTSNPSFKDEREGCRSLICDANGIIIAEMCYRCMICSNVSDSIGDARVHYHQSHIDHDMDMNGTCGSTGNTSDEPILFPEDEDVYDDEEEEEEVSYASARGSSGRGGAPFNTPSNARHHGPSVTSSHTRTGHVQRQQAQPAHAASSATTHHHSNQRTPSAHYNHFNVDHTSTTSSPGQHGSPSSIGNDSKSLVVTGGHHGGSPGGRRGKISGKPVPPEKANSIKIQTSGTNGTCTIKSGYITCPVCSCTKFYTTLQRRYGQFSCVGCYRFFKEFFVKPKRYGCPHLGQCPLDQRTKCKGCWMKKCIDVYTVDETRRELLVAHRPVKKSVVKSPTRPTNGGGLPGGAGDLISHRIQMSSTSSSPSGNNNGGGGDHHHSRTSPPVLETIVHDEDNDVEVNPKGSINNNLSSSEQEDFQVPPPKLPKLTLQTTPRSEDGTVERFKQEDDEDDDNNGHGDGNGLNHGEEEEEVTGQSYQDDDGDHDDVAMQESAVPGHSLEMDPEDGNSLDDADELPMDDRDLVMDDEDGCLDEGSSLLLPSGSGNYSYDGSRSPSKMALSRAAAIAAVSGGSGSGRSPPRRKTSGRIKNWCCLKCPNCLADDCGKCINCLDRPKFGGPFIRKQRCLYKKCLMKAKVGP